MTRLSDEELRKDFGTALIFHGDLLDGKSGFLLQRNNGTYKNQRAEALYQGYRLAMNSKDAQLARFAPDRFIGNGHLNEINEKLGLAGKPLDAEQIRTILKVVGGWPV